MNEMAILILSFALSALYSGTEAAFYATNRLKVEILRRRHAFGSQRLAAFLDQPDRYILTILVGNNIAHVLFASFAAITFSQKYPEWLVSVGATIFILVFGEVIPKSILRKLAGRAALRLGLFVRVSEIIFYPAIKILNAVSALLSKLFYASGESRGVKLSRADIRHFLRESRYFGLIDYQEEDFVAKIMRLHSVKVRKIMVPRTEIIAAPVTISRAELQRLFIRSQLSRLPLYEQDIDHVVGVAHALDLLKSTKEVRDLMRPVLIVPETQSALILLREMRLKRTAFAIIIDEYGGTEGLVSLEDIMEEIFGDIVDEHDEKAESIEQLDATTFEMPAQVDIWTVNERLGQEIPEGEYGTVGGYVIHRLGYIPRTGERVTIDGLQFIIAQADRRKIQRLKIILPPPPAAG